MSSPAHPTSPPVHGLNLDPQTRCLHYHSASDIIAIKMKCCGVYYACKDCHIALADHPIEVWPLSAWNEKAILCGACRNELTISEYLQCNSRCPLCSAPFNPACPNHHHFYFAASTGCVNPATGGFLQSLRSAATFCYNYACIILS